MSSYFSFFPSLMYANTSAVNVIAKVQFDASVLKRTAGFYPYTITDGERADQIAESYYGDASYDWVIYLGNNIIDPHNEWPKTENQMNDFLTTKYGSIANTQQQILYYQITYAYDDRVISPAVYDALSTGQKKYWGPILGYNDAVINYQRKDLDTTVETNQTVLLTGAFSGLVESDRIKQSSSITGTVGFANSTNVVLKHVEGTWTPASPVYFMVSVNVANATVTTANVINQSIPLDEITYWSPVTVYEYESLQNEKLKHIRLMSSSYLNNVERDMKDLLG